MSKWTKRLLAVLLTALLIGGAIPASIIGASAAFSTIPMVAAGSGHTVALRADGTVWAWGRNTSGQLGDGTKTDRLTPVQVKILTDVMFISAVESHTIALKSDGTVWAWGSNADGQLGDGTTNESLLPKQVAGLAGVISIAAGNVHTLALKADGTVWAWGGNYTGILGDGTTTNRFYPGQVANLTGVTAISAKLSHSVALKSDGTVWSWGSNESGRLGDGTTTNRYVPVQVQNISGAVAVAAGFYYSVAIKNDGTVWGWGRNNLGQLGDGTWTTRYAAVQTQGISDVVEVKAGFHTLALKSDGSVWSWGFNEYGALGDGTFTNRNTPAKVLGISNVIAIAAGHTHSTVIRNDGTVWTWGYPALNDGTTEYHTTPVQVKGQNGVGFFNVYSSATFSTIPMVAAGWRHTFALRSDGTVWIWGQFGSSTYSTPTKNNNIDSVIAIATGENHVLALKSDGTVWAWGFNGNGKLGDGTTVLNRYVPVQVVNLNNVKAIAANDGYSMALKNDGTVWAWGYNNQGNLGNGTEDSNVPVQVQKINNITAIAAGANHAVALKNDGTVWSWGSNAFPGSSDWSAAQVQGINNVDAVAATSGCTIALKKDGTVWTWGYNSSGQLGDGTTTDRFTPAQVQGLSNVNAINTKGGHTIVIKNDGTVWAWGGNTYGQLCDGTSTNRYSPIQVSGLTGVFSVSSGAAHIVAIKNDGSVWGSGYNAQYGLGDGTTTNRSTFVRTIGENGIGFFNVYNDNTAPIISGPTTMSLTTGYAATSTGVYTVAGNPVPTLTKTSGNASITWNNTTKKLNIAAGLPVGSYPVVLTATNGVTPNATITFTLTVSAAPTYTATISPTSKTFTGATVGYGAQTAQQFIITNTGTGTISSLAAALSGTNASSFEISTALSPTSIAAGGTATVSVRPKTGLAAGTYTATLTVTGSNSISRSATLSFTVSAAPTYTATISPTSKTFTGATVGYGAQTAQQFIITNTGTGTISSLAAALSGTNASSFEISAALSLTSIVSGGTATVSVRPKTGLAAGTYTATLTVTGSNSISRSATLSFTVSAAPTYTATISPTSKTFTGATVGYGAQTAQQFIITNTGTGTISSLAAALSGTNASSFEISTALSPMSIAAGGTATVSVRPKTGLAAGTYTATLTVTGSNSISRSATLSFTVSAANYTFGKDTYSFQNYSDSHSNGHCFGMSITSSAYHLRLLDIAIIGGNYSQGLYALSATSTVKAPICHYQQIQTSQAVVAGSWCSSNITSDWTAVVNYVKSGKYNNTGELQVVYDHDPYGHAVNFLRYAEVSGQPRIYVYDNNFPNVETYFYRDNQGRVFQAPNATFNGYGDGSITCMGLVDVAKYMTIAGKFDPKRVIYADKDAISINGIVALTMKGDFELGKRVMYEIPDHLNEVTIIPLVDNAAFDYLDNEYSFGTINKDTIGIFKLSVLKEGTITQNPSLTITQSPAQTYTVTLNANGGSVSPTSITVTKGSTYSALPTPTRSSYTFNGWYTAASGGSKVNPTDTVNLTGNTTLYAQWTQQAKKIFSTKYDATFLNWILFFVCFGWIWMWF